jgi:hypothetical protein
MTEFLKSKGFVQIYESDVPIGVPVSRRTIKNFPIVATNKWENKKEKILVRVWNGGLCTIVAKGSINNFYEYVTHDDGIKMLSKIFHDKNPNT